MSFQAYLDNAEAQTGLTPRQFIALAREQGFAEGAKAGPVIAWLKEAHGLGHGHAAALAHVITKGPKIGAKHVGKAGPHGDASDTLWLDGAASNPAAAG
ncbi:DUF4287 domain-containing protein [Agromyces archimandritae]|uniref:DUF4287 domain-containing protein n=1 Tax=Agromyces archimandritae TaxID=2781962 RepID=A0A975IN36_9MICO|nr:DUF4287 domain-containing protein [Agromyces archimandritae]QTX03829.1 DUF4287 domain-containing protein [Agromyces archimandritae]